MGQPLLVVLLFVAVTAAIAGLTVWAIRNSRAAKLRKAMREMPRTAVSAVRPGTMVKLVGRVRLLETPLQAPLTGQPCAYFHLCIQHRELDSEDDAFGRTRLTSSWVTIRHAVERRPFLLEDETGSALVKLDAPEVLILRAATEISGLLRPPPPQLLDYMLEHGLPEWRFRSLRWEERILAEGEEVAVLGRATVEAGDGGVGEPLTPVVLADAPDAPVRVATMDAIRR